MPYSVYSGDEQPPSINHRPSLSKFPNNHSDFRSHEHLSRYDLDEDRSTVQNLEYQNGSVKEFWADERWPPRKDNSIYWGTDNLNGVVSKHGRQKSLTEAFKIIRGRRGSVSANAHELADALKAPVSVRLIVCGSAQYLPPYGRTASAYGRLRSIVLSGISLRL